MSLTVEKLNKEGARDSQLHAFIKQQLETIDAELRKHVQVWGSNVIKYVLPSCAGVFGNMALKDAQCLVYSEILRSLQERGFAVGIIPEQRNAGNTLLVRWVTSISQQELTKMDSRIQTATLRNQSELERFLNA